jgi:hypothetical protein
MGFENPFNKANIRARRWLVFLHGRWMQGRSMIVSWTTTPPRWTLCRSLFGLAVLAVVLFSGCEEAPKTIRVETRPSAAKIFLNGELVGKSPCTCQIVDKKNPHHWEHHVLEARAEGYRPSGREFRYRTGSAQLPERIVLELTPQATETADAALGPQTSTANDPRLGESDGDFGGESPQVLADSMWGPVNSAERKPVPKSPAKARKTVLVRPKGQSPSEPPAKVAWASRRADQRPKDAKGGEVVVETFAKPAPAVVQPLNKPDDPWLPETLLGRSTEQVQAGWEDLPVPTRRLAVELRIVRLSDGRVLGQESILATYGDRNQLADVLVDLLAQKVLQGGRVAVGTLCNRRQSATGRRVAAQVTSEVVRAIRQHPRTGFVKRVNLRDVILDENRVEDPKIVCDARIRRLFGGAEYVVIGGVALDIPIVEEEEPPPATQPEKNKERSKNPKEKKK